MAYRFLLEAPESLAETVSVAIDQVGDAQVIVIRPSHGLGIDDPYVDLTVASHSLRVIDVLFTWYESLEAPRPDIRVVLHGGERHPLHDFDRARMVAMIRRDQPWVERSIPHVGDHEPTSELAGYSIGAGAPAIGDPILASSIRGGSAIAEVQSVVVEKSVGAAEALQIRAINYVLVQVSDLSKAERFYQEFLAMELLGRLRRNPDGTQLPLPRDYSWEDAMRTGELADTSFLSNGSLTIAAQRVGLAVIIDKGPLDLVSLGVDARTFATIKGRVLMRPLTVLRSGLASFVFRDPFNVNWEIAVLGSVPLIPA